MKTLKCEMTFSCANAVTRVGEKGYVYCAHCAPRRIGAEKTRRLRRSEIAQLENGGTIAWKPAVVRTMPKSQAGAERQYDAIIRRARKRLAGGLSFGLDWPTFAATFPEDAAHIKAMRAAGWRV